MSLGVTQGAAGNERTVVTMVNRSGSTCYLGGYPGVEMVDASGNNLGDAQRSTDSFFGTYAEPHRVEISAGGSTVFELTYGGNDPCGTTPAHHPANLKITPPGDYDSATISANPNPGKHDGLRQLLSGPPGGIGPANALRGPHTNPPPHRGEGDFRRLVADGAVIAV